METLQPISENESQHATQQQICTAAFCYVDPTRLLDELEPELLTHLESCHTCKQQLNEAKNGVAMFLLIRNLTASGYGSKAGFTPYWER